MKRIARLLTTLVITSVAVSGCQSTPPVQPPSVISFSVSPDVALQPSPQATLSWEVEHVEVVVLSTEDGEVLGEFDAMGDLPVMVSTSTTFILSADNDAGSDTASVALTVQPFGIVTLRRVASDSIKPVGAVTVGEPVDLVVRVLIVPPADTSVTAVTADLGVGPAIELRDDGSLTSGDDIFGDGVYSGRALVAFPEVGGSDITVTMVIGDDTHVASTRVVVAQALSGDELADVRTANEATTDLLATLGATSGIDDVIEAIETFTLENLDTLGVESIEFFPRYAVRHHTSGLSSVLLFYDEREGVVGSSSLPASGTKVSAPTSAEPVGSLPLERRDASPTVPLAQQTRGDALSDAPTALLAPSQGGVIGPSTSEVPRSVLVWAPFDNEFSTLPWYKGGACSETEDVVAAFAESPLGFDVTVLRDAAATVDSLRSIANYGYVLLSSHGAGGWVLVSGEVPTVDSPYMADWASYQVFPCQGVFYQDDGTVVVAQDDRWCVSSDWLAANVEDTMPNSIVFNSSCDSTMTDDFWNAFRALGAQAYLGFSENVGCKFARDRAVEFSQAIASGSTSGQAYKKMRDFLIDKDDLKIFRAEWQLLGSSWQRFASGLYNPYFHMGLAGWSTIGDGRAITRLGVGDPAQLPVTGSQMAVISSGLGFTTARGAIQQTFRVPDSATRLSFSWNFLSEEFLEFIGSSFQDQFVVSVIATDGTETTLLDMTIDSVASSLGAQHCASNASACLAERGDLSPGWDIGTGTQYIQFDRGDVWFTGWRRSPDYDISPFAGQVVTLRFFATDVTDEIFDTAVLIDNIWVD